MKIIVVKTCDGDVYFRHDRPISKNRAIQMAVEQVLENDLNRYSEEDRQEVRKAVASKLFVYKWEALVDVGAIRVVEVNS